eukprot:6209556-Pleurochrysis_carterae.AAC.3
MPRLHFDETYSQCSQMRRNAGITNEAGVGQFMEVRWEPELAEMLKKQNLYGLRFTGFRARLQLKIEEFDHISHVQIHPKACLEPLLTSQFRHFSKFNGSGKATQGNSEVVLGLSRHQQTEEVYYHNYPLYYRICDMVHSRTAVYALWKASRIHMASRRRAQEIVPYKSRGRQNAVNNSQFTTHSRTNDIHWSFPVTAAYMLLLARTPTLARNYTYVLAAAKC